MITLDARTTRGLIDRLFEQLWQQDRPEADALLDSWQCRYCAPWEAVAGQLDPRPTPTEPPDPEPWEW